MTLKDIIFHMLNFIGPALALALLAPLLSRLFVRNSVFLLPWWAQVMVNFVVGVAALAASIWWLGRDGKMLGYALLVVAVATSEWVQVRGWRR